jgi:hypothetical protein
MDSSIFDNFDNFTTDYYDDYGHNDTIYEKNGSPQFFSSWNMCPKGGRVWVCWQFQFQFPLPGARHLFIPTRGIEYKKNK